MGSDGVFAQQFARWHGPKTAIPSSILWQRGQPNGEAPGFPSHTAVWFRQTCSVRVAGFKLFVQSLPPHCTRADVHSLMHQAGLPCSDVGVFLAVNSRSQWNNGCLTFDTTDQWQLARRAIHRWRFAPPVGGSRYFDGMKAVRVIVRPVMVSDGCIHFDMRRHFLQNFDSTPAFHPKDKVYPSGAMLEEQVRLRWHGQ